MKVGGTQDGVLFASDKSVTTAEENRPVSQRYQPRDRQRYFLSSAATVAVAAGKPFIATEMRSARSITRNTFPPTS